MKKIFTVVLFLSACVLWGAKLDRSSQDGLLKSWLTAVCRNDGSAAWNALSENTRDAIKKEYSGSLAEIRSQWLVEVRKGLCRFAQVRQADDLLKDDEKIAKVIAAYKKKITFINDDGDWQLSSPRVEGEFYKYEVPQSVQKNEPVHERKDKAVPQKPVSENKVTADAVAVNTVPAPEKKKNVFTPRKKKTAAPAVQTGTVADNEKVTLALKVIRSVVKQDADGLWQLIAPSNRADIIKKCGDEDKAKKDTLKLLAIGIAMKGAPSDIDKNLASQMKMAKKFAENEKAFVEENGKPFIIAVSAPGFSNRN